MNAIIPPVMTTTIAYQTPVSDEILVNRDGSTGVQTTNDLAAQLAATSPLDLGGFQAPLFATEAALKAAVLTNKVSAWVFDDPDADKNGVWSWTGAAWVWTLPLPYSISVLENVGSGTPNAIEAASRVPLIEGMIVVIPVVTTTTASPVTIKINGNKTFEIRSMTDGNIAAGGLVEDMMVLALVKGGTLRLISDQVSAAIVAAAEGWANLALAAASSVTIKNVSSREMLKALDTTVASVAFLNTNNDSGIFFWRPGNFSSLIAADPKGAVYIKADAITAANGSWVRQHDGMINLRWFGAVGDYDTDDTAAVTAWLAFFGAALRFPLYIPQGVFRCTNNLVAPKGLIMRGVGSAKIGTFPQYDLYNKDLLRPGFKSLIGGSNLIFSGNPTNTVSGGRASTTNIKPLFIYDHFAPCDIQGVSFIQDMDVRNTAGALTTKATDNRASNYTHGIFHRGTLSRFEDLTVFGYFFGGRGFIHNNTPDDDGGIGNDPDYAKFFACYISFGAAIWGADTAQAEGNTGTEWVGCNLFGGDHHNRADSDPSIPALEIDIPLVSVQQGRGHSFSSCSFRTCANNAMKLDHCSDILFANMTTEFSEVAGVSGLDQRGIIVGTARTGNVTISGAAASGHLGLEALRGAISGRLVMAGVTNGLGGGMVVAQNLNMMRGSTLAVANSTIAPTGSYHLIDSTGSPTITAINTAGLKTGDLVMFRRSGSGTITFSNSSGLGLGGSATQVLNSAADIIVFLIDGANAWMYTFQSNA